MSRRATITLVVNPLAGKGRARRLVPKVCAEIVRGVPEVTLRVQQATSYADAKVRAMAVVQNAEPAREGERPDALVVMGGDGMASLGLNAVAGSHVDLGVIPAGTGNDFVRGVGAPTSTLAAARAIAAGHTRVIDVAEVHGALTGGAQRRLVGSVISTGYDARVNRRVNNQPRSLGSLSYGWVVLSELATFEPMHYRIEIDGEAYQLPAMAVAVGNAGYIGGGIKICPEADPADGLLDVTIIHPVSRMTLLRLFPLLYSGRYTMDPAIELVRAKHVRIAGDDMFAMADGEELGTPPLDIRVQPGAVSMLVSPATVAAINR